MKESNHVMIISGGRCDCELVRRLILDKTIDTVIVVDGGLKIADELEIVPNYIVGDFDTISQDIMEKYRRLSESTGNIKPKILEFCPEKDDTDTEIAIRLCTQLKPEEVTIVGATGSRLDHTFANLHLLKMLLDEKIQAAIYDENNKIYLTDNNLRLLKKSLYGPYFSLLPFTEKVTGLTLIGFKYPLTNKEISIGTSLCISNEVIEDTAYVELEQGILIVFESMD